MQDELLDYYNRELAFIRKMAKEFKGKYPGVAANLVLEDNKSDDPHVERLLQGFAFLAGRIRRKLDDNFPRIAESLLSVLYPHYLAPMPSMSIAQFVAAEQRKERADIEKHTTIYSRTGGGPQCRFRTCYPVSLWPIKVAEAAITTPHGGADWPLGAEAVLSITLQTEGVSFPELIKQENPDARLQALRFYIDGIQELPYQLHELIFNNVLTLQVRCGDKDSTHKTTLPAEALQPVGFAEDEGLLSYPTQSFIGYRLLQEYFVFPPKFLFFDLEQLEPALRRGSGDRMSLLFYLDHCPAIADQVTADNFVLGCAPIVNLFKKTAEPIRLDITQNEFHVIPDLRRESEMEIYSIDSVVGSVGGNSARTKQVYQPLYSYSHAAADNPTSKFWCASRRPSERSGVEGTEMFISLVDVGNNGSYASEAESPVLTLETTCINRNLPSLLPAAPKGEPDFEMEKGGAAVALIRRRLPPTKSFTPPAGSETLWRLISHLSLNYLSLAPENGEQGSREQKKAPALREMLELYDYQKSAFTRKQINGIESVRSDRVVRMVGVEHGGAAARGLRVTVNFDEEKFVGSGVFLLASVLERFFGLYVSINSFCEFVATTKQREASERGPLKTWPPRTGTQQLL